AVWVQPGQVQNSATVHFGYGRTRAGRIANGLGFNGYALRTSQAFWHASSAELKRISRGYEFATTQHTQTMEERDPVRVASITEFRKNPAFASPEEQHVPAGMSLFPLW